MFTFDEEKLTLKLDTQYESELVKGNLCPEFKEATLGFVIESDPLGEITRYFKLKVNPQSSSVNYFQFNYDWK